MKALDEKSLLVLASLALGLLITWLIASDPNAVGATVYTPNHLVTTTVIHPG